MLLFRPKVGASFTLPPPIYMCGGSPVSALWGGRKKELGLNEMPNSHSVRRRRKKGLLVKSPNEGPEMDFAVFSLLRLQDRARVSGFENGRTDVFFPSEKEFGQLYFGSLLRTSRG